MILPKYAPDAQFATLVGAEIGNGNFRKTYDVIGHPGWVIKVSSSNHQANWVEHLTYQALVGERMAEIFGAVDSVSETGKYLIMEHLRDLNAFELPQRPPVPTWFTDRKPSAFGATGGGVIKIRDYGEIKLGMVLPNAQCEPLPSQEAVDGMKGFMAMLRGKSDGE